MTRQVANGYEVPEKNVQVKKQNSPYSEEWLNSKLDILLGLVVSRLPVIGLTICQGHLDSPAWNRVLKDKLISYYTDMHSYAFEGLKRVVRSTMTKEEHDFSYDTLKGIVVDLEKEFGSGLPELGIEDEPTLSAFVKNQVKYYTEKWNWSYAA